MVYTPLTNYKYDTGLHQIQSGPNHEYFKVLSSGIQDLGADLGRIVPGPPNSGAYVTTQWRAVPPAPEGYWTNYQDVDYNPSGLLSSYEGYRALTNYKIANAKALSSSGPTFGRRGSESNLWFDGVAPDNQNYDPYNTPSDNTTIEGITGGGVTHRQYENTLLTNSLGSQGSSSRADWVYNPPVYCKTYTEAVRSDIPGSMSTVLRFMYRGRSTSYVSNIGSVYYNLPESVRNTVHRFSPTVNISNQKSI